ncbi:helix-turn-helix transcriptional regulator [Streptomyces sp. HNM0663]|uniref:Helix-turn-helix transcriptional regulator n=1 Tax=Streptomyces chengmaiensis TaxID=3040919 RepID=A0ABT6HTE5_9ACTN|nr:helix-turn-helix transcriptional regulator [Streptomyces chengmaiensis]MDH2391980.1 helix-turn-helix transcriptional regulator [Streptomyces chengmaiensis]
MTATLETTVNTRGHTMTADFGTRLRALLADRGMSMRGAARALRYDVAYLSRVVNGRQHPSAQLAAALDELLDADGQLAALAERVTPPACPDGEPPGPASDIARMQESAAYLLVHADRYGGDTVAPAAVQVWRSAQSRLDSGEIPDKAQRRYLAAVSQAAQVAGWLLFDAGGWDAARRAFLEAHMLARHAGDRPRQWFALDMLAMLDTELSRPGETRRIAEELLSERRIPPRVALLAHMRRGRAHAQAGDRRHALADLDAAHGGLEESLHPRDPEWTWWVNHREVTGHAGHALLSLGSPDAAVRKLRSVLPQATPRGVMLYRIELLRSYATARAWSEAEEELQKITTLLGQIRSGRNRHLLQEALRTVDAASGAPARLLALSGEAAASVAG